MAAFDCSCSACLFRLSRNGCSRPILRSTNVADVAQVRIGIDSFTKCRNCRCFSLHYTYIFRETFNVKGLCLRIAGESSRSIYHPSFPVPVSNSLQVQVYCAEIEPIDRPGRYRSRFSTAKAAQFSVSNFLNHRATNKGHVEP